MSDSNLTLSTTFLRPATWMPSLTRIWREQKGMATVAGWSFLAAVVARGSNLAGLAICARLLGQVEFGQVAAIQSTVGMFAPLASLGLALTTTKFVAEYRDKSPERAGRIIALSLCAAGVAGLLMTLALIGLAPVLAAKGFADPLLRKQLAESSGLLLLGVIEAVQSGALTGLEAFSRIAKLSAWGGLLSIPVTALLAYEYGTSGAIAGLTLSLAISCAFNAWVLRAECRRWGIRTTLAGCASEKGVLFSFSLPAYVSGVIVAPVSWLSTMILVQQANGFAEMALFSAADRFRYILIFIPLAVSRIAMPALSRFHAARDHGAYRSAFRWNLVFSLLATVPAAAVCALLAPRLLAVFGKSFEAGWPVLAILAISAVPTVLNTQLGAALLSNGKAWARTGVDVLLAVTFLGAAWVAVPRWNAAGLAGAFLFSYSVASAVLWRCLRQNEARSTVETEP
jgi:O-antigen/teichoic acid export membrane protein